MSSSSSASSSCVICHLLDLRRHRNTTPRVARESQRKPARPSSGRAARACVRFSPHTSELARGHDRGSQLRWQKQRTIFVNPRPSGRTVCAHEPVTIVRCCYGCRPKWTATVTCASSHRINHAGHIGGRQMHERLGLVGDLGVLEDGMRAASAFHCARAGREAIALRRGSARAQPECRASCGGQTRRTQST